MNCKKCGQEGAFSANHRVCNACRTKYNRTLQSSSPKNYLQMAVSNAKQRAKTKQVPFELTLDYIMGLWKTQKGRCTLTGLAMTYSVGDKKARDMNVSIDRIDSTKGYTLGNVHLVCSRVNVMKSDLDMTDFQWWVRTLHDHLEG